MGKRPFIQEIRAAGLALQREDKEAVRYLFARTVRKLLRRFDPVLWDGDTKFSKAVKIVERIEDLLGPLEPGKGPEHLVEPSPPPRAGAKPKPATSAPNGPRVALGTWLGRMYEACAELVDLLPQDGVNAAMVRHATYWAHTADSSMAKVIIMEGPEHFNESTRNSLLKTLEEPPEGVWFMLLSRHRQAIMQTILSRVRTYSFAERGQAEAEVITRVFRHDPKNYASLRHFFAEADSETLAVVRQASQGLWAAMTRTKDAPKFEDLMAMAARAKDWTEDVLRMVLDMARQEVAKPLGMEDLDRLHFLVSLTSREGNNALAYNRSLPSLVEALYTTARGFERRSAPRTPGGGGSR